MIDHKYIPPVQKTAKSRLDDIRAKRLNDQILKKANQSSLFAWLLPLITFGIGIAGLAMFHKNNSVLGFINIFLIIIASMLTIRTWVNIIKYKISGLWFGAIAGTILNGFMLVVIGMVIAVQSRGR